MIYVGSAESEEYDQVLDSVFVGPIPEGKHMFVFQVITFYSNIIFINYNIINYRQIHQTCLVYQKMTLLE